MRLFSSPLCLLFLSTLPATVASAQTGSYYVEPGTYATQRESDPPSYVGQPEGLDWLDLGLQYRTRYEYRSDDIRRPQANSEDEPLLRRARLYAGVRGLVDPLRFAIELQDSRRGGSRFAPDNRDVNEAEFIQGFGELYFADALGTDPRGNARPLGIRAGRLAFEALDRRLIGRNEWRNTTNTFEGVRVHFGQDSNDWHVEAMSLKPIKRLLEDTDEVDDGQRFDAVIGHWRALSPQLTIEPHYFRLKQKPSAANAMRTRDIHAPGLRISGKDAAGALNYELTAMMQFGEDGPQDQEAHSFTLETGYTFLEHPWRPRFSAFYGYASGDRDPNDGESNRFERFFGFARPWSADDYVIFENIHAPKLKVEFQPLAGVRVDAGYGAFRLASTTDRFNNLLAGGAFNRDPSGRSGDEVGQSIDGRVRFNLGDYVETTIGYSHFRTGNFVENRQRAATGTSAEDSDFFYIELVFSLF